MPQNDFDIANQAGAAFRSDVNSALQALATLSSAATAPATTYARMLWADTTTNTLKRRNAANSGWIVVDTLDESFVLSRSSNTILDLSDGRGDKVLIATGSYTQTFDAAATLGDGWEIDVIVDAGVTLTLDPNAPETIDGSTTRAITGPAQGRIVCNGTLFRTIGFGGNTLDTTRSDVASAATVNLTSSAPNTRHINITGTTTITAFTVAAGLCYFVRFAGALTLTNNANIVTQTGANIVTQSGDTCILRATAANTVEVLAYTPISGVTLGTMQATTSGTSIDFTGIPAWARLIVVSFNGLSTNGTSPPIVQLGDSGGPENTGYSGAFILTNGSGAGSGGNHSSGFLLAGTHAASNVIHGHIILALVNPGTNLWSASISTGLSDVAFGGTGGGSKSLTAQLDRLRLTTVGGADTLDLGNWNIAYF